MDITIRSANENDAAAIAAIYNHYVANTHITFETEAVNAEQMAERIAETIAMPLPWLIAESSNSVIGNYYSSCRLRRSKYPLSRATGNNTK